MAFGDGLRILGLLTTSPGEGDGDPTVIAERTGIGRSTVLRTLHDLEDAGLALALKVEHGKSIPWAITDLGAGVLKVLRLKASRQRGVKP